MLPNTFLYAKITNYTQTLGGMMETESYGLNWVGKRATLGSCNLHTDKVFSLTAINGNKTKNLFIEGDNIHSLKLLSEVYSGKVKFIYADPPYNTNSSGLMYKDNSVSHSEWLNFMYPRLWIARELLSADGVIAISIDEHEYAQAKLVCDEIFGEHSFVIDLVRKTKTTTNDHRLGINNQHDMCLVFAKDVSKVSMLGGKKDLSAYKNPDNDPNGEWMSGSPTPACFCKSKYFPVVNPYTGKVDYPPDGQSWIFTKNTVQGHIDSGRIKFKKSHKPNERGFIFKRYKRDLKTDRKTLSSLVCCDNSCMNMVGTNELKRLGMPRYFSYPKSIPFMTTLLEHCTDSDSIVLDMFLGSGTTAHAVMELNATDGGTRSYIGLQIAEPIKENSAAYESGFRTVSEVTLCRLKKASELISTNNSVDTGFIHLSVSDNTYDTKSVDLRNLLRLEV